MNYVIKGYVINNTTRNNNNNENIAKIIKGEDENSEEWQYQQKL